MPPERGMGMRLGKWMGKQSEMGRRIQMWMWILKRMGVAMGTRMPLGKWRWRWTVTQTEMQRRLGKWK
jgi:hypothetical protein